MTYEIANRGTPPVTRILVHNLLVYLLLELLRLRGFPVDVLST